MEVIEDMEKHIAAHAMLYAGGALRPERHRKLVEDLERLSAIARVRPEFVSRGMKAAGCAPDELEWVRGLRRHARDGRAGLAYVGAAGVEDRASAVAGACLRNYVDARVRTVQEVVQALRDGEGEDPYVLVIPNFHVGSASGGDLPSWQVSSLLGMLYSRYLSSRLTVVGVQSLDALAESYGAPFRDHLEKHYTLIQ